MPHHPLSLFQNLHSDINRLFDELSHGFGSLRPDWHDAFSGLKIKVDIKSTANDIVVTAEVPGVEMEDLDIVATPNYVSISGEKRAEKEEKEKGLYRLEREYGYFRRVVPLPCEIEKEKADAVFKNGVLTLTMPKTKGALEEEHKVTVKAG